MNPFIPRGWTWWLMLTVQALNFLIAVTANDWSEALAWAAAVSGWYFAITAMQIHDAERAA